MKSSSSRDIINPMELITKWWPKADISHITYNPNMKSKDREFWRQDSAGHDGTLIFTIEMLYRLLIPLIQCSVYYKRTKPEHIYNIHYTIGTIRHATVFGMVNLKCGRYPGQTERVRIPVTCEYNL